MAITKDMVADYAADNTGVANVTPKFYVNLSADMQGQDTNLTIPAGSYNFATYGGPSFIEGALDLTAVATGATLSGAFSLGSLHLSQIGVDEGSGKSARIQTVSAGSTSVTLTAASASAGHISRFTVGKWIMVCGWPLQANFQSAYSFPPNYAFHDFVKITGIVGNTISFATPLDHYYSAAWPDMNRGSAFEVDGAGAATIFAMAPGWGGTTTFTGGSYDNNQLINCYRENFIINGGTSVDFPIYPSVTKLYRAINHTATVTLTEHDKLCDTVDIQGGSYSQWKTQSASTKTLTMTGVTIGTLNGTPGDTTLESCTITGGAVIGAIAYGRSNTFVAKNTSFATAIPSTVGLSETGPSDGLTNNHGPDEYMRMSGGVITTSLVMGDSATRTLVPDAAGRNALHWLGTNGTIGAFRVLSITADSWPAADDQTATVNITMAQNSKAVQSSSAIFTAGDLYKTIIIPNAVAGGGDLRTFITGVTDAQNITVFYACTLSGGISASSRSIRWGTCNMYVQTDQTGGFPSSSLWTAGSLRIQVPPVRSLRFENCTGNDQAIDLSQATAWNRPLFSYTKRTYDGLNGTSAIPMKGNLVSFKVNVTTPYTGTAPTLQMGLTQFGNFNTVQGGAYVNYNPRINLKQTGERVITIGSTTGAWAGATPDTGLNLSVPTWIATLGSGYAPFIGNGSTSVDISGESVGVRPSFTVEMITDQGFYTGPVAVVPLRLRLRAA